MTTTVTFYAPSKFARYVQDNVKRYDGRFVRNPNLTLDRGWFEVSFEDSSNYNKFMVRTDILNEPWV